jgi:hypothetical protein
VSDIGRYLLNIQRAKDTFDAVSITSQMPGWPAGGTGSGSSFTGPAGPYGPGSPTSSIGPYGSGVPGAGFASAPTETTLTAAAPTTIDFTATGLLTQKFQFVPPVYAASGAATDTTGFGASSFGPGGPMPGTPGYLGPGTSQGPYPSGGGSNGAGGSNGGS